MCQIFNTEIQELKNTGSLAVDRHDPTDRGKGPASVSEAALGAEKCGVCLYNIQIATQKVGQFHECFGSDSKSLIVH